MKIGILKEQKRVPDSRVPLTPKQVAFLRNELDIDIVVESSPTRCFSDVEYSKLGIPVVHNLEDRDVLIGIKEVPSNCLLDGKTYFFFSHTIKRQAYNRSMLQAILQKKIRLIDYELLTNTYGHRIIAFGHFAGMVGAHNALWNWGYRTKAFNLKRMYAYHEYFNAKESYDSISFPPLRIVLTGTGRVGTGALNVLKDMGFKQVDPVDYLAEEYDMPIFTQLLQHHYAAHKEGDAFDKSVFYNDPARFVSTFWPYAKASDIMINGIYWQEEAPPFFTKEQMRHPDFRIKVIADISCDLAPNTSIPSTIKHSTIKNPVFGYNPITEKEDQPFQENMIDMMTIDNLPNELPRNASQSFGKQFITKIMGELMKHDQSDMLEQATIAKNGKLTRPFLYLKDWVSQDETFF